MTFQALNQISDAWQPNGREKRVLGLVTGFRKTNHTLWLNFRPFHSLEITLSKVTSQIWNPSRCVLGPPQHGGHQWYFSLQPRKQVLNLKDVHLFMSLLVPHLYPLNMTPIQSGPNVTHGVFIVALKNFCILLYGVCDVLPTIVTFYLQLQ